MGECVQYTQTLLKGAHCSEAFIVEKYAERVSTCSVTIHYTCCTSQVFGTDVLIYWQQVPARGTHEARVHSEPIVMHKMPTIKCYFTKQVGNKVCTYIHALHVLYCYVVVPVVWKDSCMDHGPKSKWLTWAYAHAWEC